MFGPTDPEPACRWQTSFRLEKLTAIGWDRNNPDCIPRTMEAIHAIHPHAVPVVAGWEPGLDTRIKEEHNMTEIDRTC